MFGVKIKLLMILLMLSGNDSASRTCGRDQLEVVILSIVDLDMDSSPVCGMSSWYNSLHLFLKWLLYLVFLHLRWKLTPPKRGLLSIFRGFNSWFSLT